MGNKNGASVYAEISALNNWSTKLNKLNQDAIDILDNIDKEIDKVENAWVGNASKGFMDSCESLITIAKNYHTGMKETDAFLVTVANHMQER